MAYENCCEPFHLGGEPPTALQLMRSRYSAYALHKTDYIQKTTHPKNRQFSTNLKKWSDEIDEFCNSTKFVKLEIEGHGDNWVSFKAYLIQQGKPYTLQEKSQFEQVNSHWRYLSGVVIISP